MRAAGALFLLWLLSAAAAATISVDDFTGETLTLQQPAKRIVALAPHIVENLYSAGAGDQIVGAVTYSDYPASARAIARVGSYNAVSIEQILALNPDLVVLWGSGGNLHLRSQLQRLGIAVYVSELRQLADIGQSIRRLATLAGTDAVGAREAARIERALASLKERFQHRAPVSVFYQIWHEPLQTISGDHLINQLITLCGGRNVFSDARSLAPTINIESVLQRDPMAIVASGMSEARPQWLDAWQAYPTLQAVKTGALFFIDPNHIQRPTARILYGAATLCRQLDSVRKKALP